MSFLPLIWPREPYFSVSLFSFDVFIFFYLFQVEADLGYPGGKAKIIHKESDIIMAFAINKVSCGC